MFKCCLPEQQDILVRTVDLKRLATSYADYKAIKANLESEAALDYVVKKLRPLIAHASLNGRFLRQAFLRMSCFIK